MTYNTDRRKPLTKAQRPVFLELHKHRCYWCGQPITDDKWDDEHIIPKEMMPPGSDWNSWDNRAPIHRDPCHRDKTRRDVAAIAKSNRIRRANGPIELRKKRKKIVGRTNFHKGRKLQSRPFQKRDAKWPRPRK